MKRFLFFAFFLVCLVSASGQGGSKMKVTSRIPAGSVAVQSPDSVKAGTKAAVTDEEVVDGSQRVQTRAGGLSNNTFTGAGANGLQLPQRINTTTAAKAEPKRLEPTPVFIERERVEFRAGGYTRDNTQATFAFFRETPQLHIPKPELQIRIDTVTTDEFGISHVKGAQLYRNIPVYGMDFTFHISASSERFMGYTVDSTQMDTLTAKLSAHDAIRIAERDLGGTTTIRTPDANMKQLLNYTQPGVEAVYYPDHTNTYRYCYRVLIRPNFRDRWIYYIDAHSSRVLEKYNQSPTDGANTGTGRDLNNVSRTVNTYLENGVHYMANVTKPMFKAADFSGFIGVYDTKGDKKVYETGSASFATSSSTSWNNPASVSTMYHASLIYDYLKNTFNRNSFDNKGSTMQIFVNFCDEDGSGYDNAFWNGSIVALGNGGYVMKNLAGALDIIAHEFGHAVVEHTANLEYKNQSGAINEAYADIFGAMVDRANWTIGEAVMNNRTYFPTGFIRDMSNPHNGGRSIDDACWQPASVSEMYLGTEDKGGVHINNSIPAQTFYTYALAVGKERAEQVYYHALSKYLTPTSKFIDLRKAVIQSARDRNHTSDVATIEKAFDKVGIIDDTVVPVPPPDVPTNPGQQELLIVNTDPADRNSLYKVTGGYKNFTALTQTVMTSTPSVTDDGKKLIFVDGNNNIRQYDMSTGKETVINQEGDNQSVTISRDGKRMAVITTIEDARIWVYDFDSNKWKAFKLYNPTTGTGHNQSGGPRYADAIEFDHTGENILYDAYNVSGQSIGKKVQDYWDIGLINVWDNSRRTWGDGEVVKLFSNLSAGVQVFNPVFSKNSPHIIALDFYDDEDGNATVGVNVATGDVDVLFLNNVPSYPSYSMDDRHIAFMTWDDWYEDYYAGYFKLGNDKISTTGDEVIFCEGGGYPVYYGTGTRQMNVKPVASFTSDARTGGNPLKVQFIDTSTGSPTSWRWTFQGGTPSSSTAQHPQVTYNTAGTYVVSLTATNSAGSNDLVRQGYISITATGIEFIEQPPVAIYPNPATGYVLVSGLADRVLSVRLFDLTGKAIPVTHTPEGDKIRIDLSALPPGVYILHIIQPDGKTSTHKIMKN